VSEPGTKPSALVAALAAPGAAVLGFFFLLPLGVVSAEAFADGGAGFARLFELPQFWGGLRNTILLGLAAGAISVVVGLAVAMRLSRMSEGARTVTLLIVSLPLTFSGLIVAYGFILGFGRAGFFTLLIAGATGIDAATIAGAVYSPYGLAFVYAYYLVPRVVMLLVPVLVNFDANQLAAAETMGASRFRATFDILLPQILPTALAAFCLVAAVAFGAYGTAIALVGSQVNILPLQLFAFVSDVNTDFPKTAALALVLTLLCSLAMAAGETAAARAERRSGH
jgi:putative spermidine/putrescine transport system permease protein